MGETGSVMPQIATATTGLGYATSAFGQIMQGRNSKQVADYNAHIADLQAQNALAQGREQELVQRRHVAATIGAQRAGYAGQGVAVNSGTAEDMQAGTAYLGEMDALTIRNNAAMEAWGYKAKGTAIRYQGDMAQRAALSNAGGTLLTGIGDTWLTGHKLGLWGDQKTKGKTPTFA